MDLQEDINVLSRRQKMSHTRSSQRGIRGRRKIKVEFKETKHGESETDYFFGTSTTERQVSENFLSQDNVVDPGST